jgi:hypothetical protein
MWFSRRAIGLHAIIIVIIPTFAALCLWQIRRAVGGNELSWAYVFEWPFFAGYAIYMWWRLIHEVPPPETMVPVAAVAGNASSEPSEAETAHAERDAYNQYLAELAARNKRKQWR